MSNINFNSIRLLNPFRGVLQIVRLDIGRLLSLDGINWRLQIKTNLQTVPWGLVDTQSVINAYVLYGIWSEKQGLTRLPLNPGIDPDRAQVAAEHLLEALENLPEIPFALKDNIEYWLLDSDNLRPLVLINSICHISVKPKSIDNDWQPTLSNDNSLSIRISDNSFSDNEQKTDKTKYCKDRAANEYLRKVFSKCFNQSITGSWIERQTDGSGIAIKTKAENDPVEQTLFAASDFPKCLLAINEFPGQYQKSLQDYVRWQAPFLLSQQGIDDQDREQWKIDAFNQPMLVHDLYKTYPKLINKKLINAALVEAVLRKAAEN